MCRDRSSPTLPAKGRWCAPLLALWLVLIAGSSGAAAAALPSMPLSIGQPLVERIGCKVQGASLVCDGKILQNRLKRPRLKAKEQPKAAAPSVAKSKPAKSQTAKTPSTKTQSSKASSSKSQAAKGGTPPPEQEGDEGESQAASVSPEDEQDTGTQASDGKEPEPVAKEAAKPAEPTVATPSSAATPAAPSPDGQASGAPASSPPAAQAAASALPAETCCASQAIDRSSGLALPGDGAVSLCGASEQDAKGMLAAFAELKDYLLVGDVSCEPK